MKKYITLLLICFSLTSCKKNAIEGYEWLEGTWEMEKTDYYGNHDWAKIIITSTTYKEANSLSTDGDINTAPEKDIAIGRAYNYYQDREMLALDTNNLKIGIDEENMQVFLALDEYTTWELHKKDEKPKEDIIASEDASKGRGGKSRIAKGMTSIEKAWSQALEKEEYIYFSTGYSDLELPYYMVFHPFVFSENGLRGICYFVSYGEESYRRNITARLGYYGEYEIVGEYLRLSDIIQNNRPDNYAKPRIYKIATVDGKIQLTGRFIRQDEISTNTQILSGTPELIITLIERANNCLHQ